MIATFHSTKWPDLFFAQVCRAFLHSQSHNPHKNTCVKEVQPQAESVIANESDKLTLKSNLLIHHDVRYFNSIKTKSKKIQGPNKWVTVSHTRWRIIFCNSTVPWTDTIFLILIQTMNVTLKWKSDWLAPRNDNISYLDFTSMTFQHLNL